ncbi:aspartic proteinase-like protein 2, partial [Trifolium medium]|nr:aspartic proteinase-like protein 2 [Trifolium medium]
MAEGAGLQEALNLVVSLNLIKVIIELDSERIVTAVKKKIFPRNRWGRIAENCARFLDRHYEASITWVKRDGNAAAHHLARW